MTAIIAIPAAALAIGSCQPFRQTGEDAYGEMYLLWSTPSQTEDV